MEYPLSQLKKVHSLTEEFIADLAKRIRRLEVAKNKTLLFKGDICRDLYLIEEGMLACYDTDDNDKRKKYCTWIMMKGDFVTAVDSFNNQVISSEMIRALSYAILWVITKKDLEELTIKHSEFQIIRQILTDLYHHQSRMMDAKRRRPPEIFYQYLCEAYPEMVRNAPKAALASLMGISRNSLYEILRLFPDGNQ
jgi:CRP-like cAMP-binding protein